MDKRTAKTVKPGDVVLYYGQPFTVYAVEQGGGPKPPYFRFDKPGEPGYCSVTYLLCRKPRKALPAPTT